MYIESYADFKKRFLRKLKKEMRKAGLTQRQQILVGLDARYVSRIKKGDRNITIKTIWKICRAGGFDPVRLF